MKRKLRFPASEGPQPDSFKYYSTQRPIDIGTFPKGGGNDPIRFQNYDKRLPVEAARSWPGASWNTENS